MSSLVEQSTLDGALPVVVNNLNVPKPASGDPTLLTFDETETLFHEFGHALHGLFARVAFPTFSGTNVFRDFVELPSQVNELWMLRPEIVAGYAVHHETGERMPRHLVDRLLASRTFNEGFSTTEYLAAAVLDQAWHRLSPGEAAAITDVAAFERAALAAAGLDDPLIPPRYSSTYFAHSLRRRLRRRLLLLHLERGRRAPTSWRGSMRTAGRPVRTAPASAPRSSLRADHATRASLDARAPRARADDRARAAPSRARLARLVASVD